MRAAITFAWLGWLGLALPAAQAAIVDCQPAAGAQKFTVFLSEPGGLQGAALQNFLKDLQFQLDQSRDGRWINRDPRKPDVQFIACPGRAPALDGQDFGNPTLIDGLYSRRVLMEVWGQLSVGTDGAAPALSAQMNYLLVPMQFAANQREEAPAALQRLRYPEQGTVAERDPVQLISRPLDLDAFVAAAYGFKLLRERQRGLAHSNLCRASALLTGMSQRPQLSARGKAALE
ncbi:MAG TPA: hypothetical protein VJN44_09510, partial [Roseateles sp.]|nr:hypothetical protein [Roseateles sp.]